MPQYPCRRRSIVAWRSGASSVVALQVVVTLSRIIVMIAMIVLVTHSILKLQKASLHVVLTDRLGEQHVRFIPLQGLTH